MTILAKKEVLIAHKMRLAALAVTAALSGAALASANSFAMVPADGGAGSAATAKAKKAEKHKIQHHRTSTWAPIAKRSQRELDRRDSATWTPPNEAVVQKYIKDALARHHGNVTAAYKDVDGKRHKRRNFYDQNLAIASDYFRARKDVQHGSTPAQESAFIGGYMHLKRAAQDKGRLQALSRGNGPVSPYSDLEKEYMYKGVGDQIPRPSPQPGPPPIPPGSR